MEQEYIYVNSDLTDREIMSKIRESIRRKVPLQMFGNRIYYLLKRKGLIKDHLTKVIPLHVAPDSVSPLVFRVHGKMLLNVSPEQEKILAKVPMKYKCCSPRRALSLNSAPLGWLIEDMNIGKVRLK